MSSTVALRRIFIIVWDWNSGLHPIPPKGLDEWGAEGIAHLLVRVDQVNSPDALGFLSDLIAAYLPDAHVLVFLHANQSSHRYASKSRGEIYDRLGDQVHLRQKLSRLKINLFGGGGTPIYYDPDIPHCRGFLGSKGNFPSIFQDPNTGKEQEVRLIVDAEQNQLTSEPFRHVWGHYWVNTRQKVYSLMENFRLWIDDFDPARYKDFTQYLRNEQGLLWPQLVYFTQIKTELKQLPEVPKHEWADFTGCEQQLELAYDGTTLADQYRAARKTVEHLALIKSHKSSEEAVVAISEIYNALDALQNAIPEALSYDTIAHFPR